MSRYNDIICDKCGASIIASRQSALIHLWSPGTPRGTGNEQRIDLCPECYEKIINWLESEVEK